MFLCYQDDEVDMLHACMVARKAPLLPPQPPSVKCSMTIVTIGISLAAIQANNCSSTSQITTYH